MATEIEAKLKVDSLPNIKEKLKKLKADFIGKQTQTDFYFDDERNRLKKADQCLRLRTITEGKTKKIFLTYKGAKQKNNLKKRMEFELRINDIAAARRMLQLLGYRQRLIIKKKRSLWRLNGCLVSLDSVDRLGSFVEIEGPNSRVISRVQKKMALAHLKHIPKSYACLLEQKNLK